MFLLDTNLLVRMTRSSDPQGGVARVAVRTLRRRNERLIVVPQNLYDQCGGAGRALLAISMCRPHGFNHEPNRPVRPTYDDKHSRAATSMTSILRAISRLFGGPADASPSEFTTQILEPTGGRILRPRDWFYAERHRGPKFMWTISREDTSGDGKYTTGVRIQVFAGVAAGTGKTAQQFVRDFVASKMAQAERVVGTRESHDQGLFTRIGLETEEGPYHIMYSLFWGSNGLDIAVISIAGTTKELWPAYASTFDRMAAFDLIDMSRFGGGGPVAAPDRDGACDGS